MASLGCKQLLRATRCSLLYAAIGALLILLLGGCTIVVKQGTAPPVDPLTRKHYPTLEGKT